MRLTLHKGQPTMHHDICGFRASIFHIVKSGNQPSAPSYEYIEDGLLIIENGRVKDIGTYSSLKKTIAPETRMTDYSGKIMMPGFVDCHTHYPQTNIIASHGKQLLDWLKDYTYPEEMKFQDYGYCIESSRFFLDELLRQGTTCALVLPTVHSQSVHALFEEADNRKMRIVSGKIMMDRAAPPKLKDTAEQGYLDSKLIIDRWHSSGRLSCAVIIRFALTSSEAQLKAASALIKENPGLLFHTHLSENISEVKAISDRFPKSRSYLDVYDQFGLTGKTSVFAHGIHLDENDYMCLNISGSSIALCPTSNLFLGSGLFDLKKMAGFQIKTALGTDVGAGTSFSMFRTMAEAYKVCQLKGHTLSPVQAFYMASLGGAEILGLDDKIGNFEKGKEADFIVINPANLPILQRRIEHARHFEDILFALMIMGDDRIIEHCHILGNDHKPLSSLPLYADVRQKGAE